MTKADLVDRVTALGDLTRRDGEIIVDTLFESVIGALKAGDKIEIRGFGSFRTRQRNSRIGRNPKTGERVDVPAKRVPFFKPSKELRDSVNPGGVKSVAAKPAEDDVDPTIRPPCRAATRPGTSALQIPLRRGIRLAAAPRHRSQSSAVTLNSTSKRGLSSSTREELPSMPIAIEFFVGHAYAILFLWVLVEQLGLPVPSIPLLLTAGTLSATHRVHFSSALLAVIAACLISDSTWFCSGRRFGSARHPPALQDVV